MRLDFAALRPRRLPSSPTCPTAVATPVILRTIEELPSVGRWTVMVQREIADRLRAGPGSRTYGSPSALAQLACEVKIVRLVDPAVFRPRPRVASAILGMRRIGPAADPATRELVRAAFAHRRKSLARSLEHVRPGSLAAARAALAELGLGGGRPRGGSGSTGVRGACGEARLRYRYAAPERPIPFNGVAEAARARPPWRYSPPPS